jgi:hypothetical protein
VQEKILSYNSCPPLSTRHTLPLASCQLRGSDTLTQRHSPSSPSSSGLRDTGGVCGILRLQGAANLDRDPGSLGQKSRPPERSRNTFLRHHQLSSTRQHPLDALHITLVSIPPTSVRGEYHTLATRTEQLPARGPHCSTQPGPSLFFDC